MFLMTTAIKSPRIALVGPCSSGKSTLGTTLKQMGYEVRQVAQEHSYVQNMWQRISKPDILIYLDVDYKTARVRRPFIDGGPQRLADQHYRLQHALKHCDFYLDTSNLAPNQVQQQVLDFLENLT
jgi:thymidylate kinase